MIIFPNKFLFGQIESSSSIILIDSIVLNPTIKGIKSVTSLTDGINSSFYVSGKTNYSVATGINAYLVNLAIQPNIIEGLILNFKAQNMNTGNVSLSVDGSTYYPVLKNNGSNLDSAEIMPNQIISVLFNGTEFICISSLFKACKNGFVSVNNEYCIDALPRGVSSFYPAVEDCGDENAMLCTLNQWYFACQDSLINGSSGYLTNFEWVNDAGNNSSDAKLCGYNDAPVYNGYGCKKSYSLPPNLTFLNSASVTSSDTVYIKYRCCYKK